MSRDRDPERAAVETLARLAGTPSPPPGLRIGVRSSRNRALKVAATVALTLAAAAGWMIWRPPRIPARGPVPSFVVEHLRVRGRPVEPRVLEAPGSGALVLTVSGETRRKPGQPPAAAVFAGALGGGR